MRPTPPRRITVAILRDPNLNPDYEPNRSKD